MCSAQQLEEGGTGDAILTPCQPKVSTVAVFQNHKCTRIAPAFLHRPPHLLRIHKITTGSMLTAEEVTVAASKLPRLPDREQRERVQAMRAAHPDGISKKALQEFPVGLTHRGDPLKWPCNTMHRGRVLVEGGELVNPSDSKLAEEAMAMLKEDFADFDA